MATFAPFSIGTGSGAGSGADAARSGVRADAPFPFLLAVVVGVLVLQFRCLLRVVVVRLLVKRDLRPLLLLSAEALVVLDLLLTWREGRDILLGLTLVLRFGPEVSKDLES